MTYPSNEEQISQAYLEKLEMLIWTSTMNTRERDECIRKVMAMQYMGEAYDLEKYLERFRPIPGLESVPQTVREQVEATRRRADMEDFKERQ